MSGLHAELHFEFEGKRGATRYHAVRQDPPWKVVRGFQREEGECLVHLNNVSGGIFGGDSLVMHGVLQPGAEVQLTTTGATRLYRPRVEAKEAELLSTFHLGEDALLEYLPDALIPFENARALQHTSYSLDAGATLFAWDVIAPGRKASGELFRYEWLKLITEIAVCGVPILNDRLLLEPRRWAVDSPGRFGSEPGYLATFVAVQAGAAKVQMRALEESLTELLAECGGTWGATTLPAHGVMVRGMVTSSLEVLPVLHAVWAHCKQELTGRAAMPPRKIH